MVDFAGKRAMVVDDESSLRFLVTEVLKDNGLLDVLPVEDGAIALATVDTFEPDIILLDLMMKTDGWTTVSKLRAACRRSGTAMPRIVIMTAGWRAKEAAEEMSLKYYCPKPFSTKELVDTVSAALADSPPSVGAPA